MTSDEHEARLVKNEQLLRDQNATATKAIRQYFSDEKDVLHAPVNFTCECSDLECRKPVKASIADYNDIHERRDLFMVSPGHERLTVERVIRQTADYHVVEKYALNA